MSAENVQEFRVITGISSAEFGRGGSQITAVTRAGSNDWHGSAFWFHRNDYFGANFFFNNSSGVPRAPLRMHQFGGRVGGPIWKDKAFFFYGHQHTREFRARPENRTVYTAEARQGIFRFLNGLTATPERVAANPGLIRHINLLECGARIMTLLGRNCFDSRFGSAGAEISSGNTQLDSFIMGQYLANIPLPNNFDIGDGLNTGGFRFNSDTLTLEHLPSFRLDYRFNDKHLFYGTINYVDRNIDGDFINGRNPIFPAFGSAGRRLTLSRSFAGALVSNFTQTIVNEVRWGRVGGENAFDFIQPLDTPFQLGLTRVTDAYTGGDDSARDNVTMNVRDTLSWVRGAHSVKFGGEWRDRSVRNVSISG
ncbi:MAG: hypothetical protein L0Z53_08030, partial [Acidobacteriales bacterium]|nr:hypothetical protein [Terriglobales bacterium]